MNTSTSFAGGCVHLRYFLDELRKNSGFPLQPPGYRGIIFSCEIIDPALVPKENTMKRLLSFFLAIGLSCSLALPAAALEAEDAKQLLETYYIDTLPEGFSEMTSLEEIIAAIDDPYTTYLSAEEYQNLLNSINGLRVWLKLSKKSYMS
jgi:hypothetical protein